MPHPVIIGVADVKNKDRTLRRDGSDEPAALILQAIEAAVADTGSGKVRAQDIDSISVVRPWSWPYPDLPALLASRLGARPSFTTTSPHGGNQPAKLLDEACRAIAQGRSKLALITGGEALDSLSEYIKAQEVPPPGWTEVDDFAAFAADALKPPSGETLEGIHGLGAPIQVYALYENALRAREGASYADNHRESAEMYADFSRVSADNANSWHHGQASSAAEIGTATKKNRMINTPYTMLMCAFNKVNIAASVLVTSDEHAAALGIDASRYIYVRGGAGTAETDEFYRRGSFAASPAIGQSIDAALAASALTRDQIDVFDFYSCFPVVPKLACRHLGLPTVASPRPITVLGGLTSFGGAGNNYSMHAITELTRRLRRTRQGQGRENNALVLANGGILSYQHVVCLSTAPASSSPSYPAAPPLGEYTDDIEECAATAEGAATIETYTVDFGRKGDAKRGHIVGRLAANGRRFIANAADEHTLRTLTATDREVVGLQGRVWTSTEDEGRNLFSLVAEQRL